VLTTFFLCEHTNAHTHTHTLTQQYPVDTDLVGELGQYPVDTNLVGELGQVCTYVYHELTHA
jgi:hypothetical protein